ncbi:MAG: hypothetical protein HYS57_00270, partial [Parcubacteria group bacterium]|nr:hypothetical protein [Parcubacteria group bacterium]
LESMSREMRTGTNFVEIVSNSELEFKNQTGQTVRYRLRNGRIERSEGAGYAPLTAPEVTVEAFKFWIDGQGVGDDEQPRVTISLKISAQLGNQRASTVLQTTVTARELDS